MHTSMRTFTKHFDDYSSVISPEAKSFWRAKFRRLVFEALWRRFSELADAQCASKANIAHRLDVDPSQITRWMNHPSNMRLDTLSDLFLAMNSTPDLISCAMDQPANNRLPYTRMDRPEVSATSSGRTFAQVSGRHDREATSSAVSVTAALVSEHA